MSPVKIGGGSLTEIQSRQHEVGTPDLMIVVSQRFRRTFQQGCQPSLTVHKRQRSQVLAVKVQ
jgi:hypothetical protein